MAETRSPRRISSFINHRTDENKLLVEVENAFLRKDYRKALLLGNQALSQDPTSPQNLEQDRIIHLDEARILYKQVAISVSSREDTPQDRIAAVVLQSWTELKLNAPPSQQEKAQPYILLFLDTFHHRSMSSSLLVVLVHALVALKCYQQACMISTDFVRQLRGDNFMTLQVEEIENILFTQLLPRYTAQSPEFLQDFLRCLAQNEAWQDFPTLQDYGDKPQQQSIQTILQSLPSLSLKQPFSIQSSLQNLFEEAEVSLTSLTVRAEDRGVFFRTFDVAKLFSLSKSFWERYLVACVKERVVYPLVHSERRQENRMGVGMTLMTLWLGRKLSRELAKHVMGLLREILDALMLPSSSG